MYNLDIPRRLLLTGGRSTALAMPTAATDCLCSHQRALRRSSPPVIRIGVPGK